MKISEHLYSDGRRQRWYSDENAARLVLSRVALASRGQYTMTAPIQTSPGIWRVDDYPRPH